jgi:hypothetical protein
MDTTSELMMGQLLDKQFLIYICISSLDIKAIRRMPGVE